MIEKNLCVSWAVLDDYIFKQANTKLSAVCAYMIGSSVH
jgi:hypothetical protein